MIDMPRHEEHVNFEDAIRAIELVHNYVSITNVAGKSRAARLYPLTNRSAVGWIYNPPVGTPDGQIKTFIVKILADLRARPKASDSDKVGVANLRCTLQAYLEGK
jgi:hypothetical protein